MRIFGPDEREAWTAAAEAAGARVRRIGSAQATAMRPSERWMVEAVGLWGMTVNGFARSGGCLAEDEADLSELNGAVI